MGSDGAALVQLGGEERGELEPEDLSGHLIVQLGNANEDLNIEIAIPADPLYQHLLLTAEKKFWRCVQTGEPPRLFGVEPPRPRIEAVRVVDMSTSNSWAEFAGLYCRTRSAFLDHEKAKAELKGLMPEDAKEAFGHGVRAKRSKSGAVSFELFTVACGEQESHAAHQ